MTYQAHLILDALQNAPFDSPAHVMLREVRNATGGTANERYADAIVASVWPSRGLWIAGIEVKVSKSDWKAELRNPAKSSSIQRFCDYWYVAVPDGLVSIDELPETWGLVTVKERAGKLSGKIVRRAPKLDPEPLSMVFVASILRNASASVQNQIGLEKYRWEEQRQTETQELRAFRGEKLNLERSKESLRKKCNDYETEINAFEAQTGIRIGGWRANAPVDVFRLAQEMIVNRRIIEDAGRAIGRLSEAATEAMKAIGAADNTERHG